MMSRRIFVSVVLALSCVMNMYAGQDEVREKVVTSRWSFVSGSATYANHYFTNQEYNGEILGAKMEFGAFYKRSENLSWDFDASFVMSPYSKAIPDFALANPAKTTFVALYDFFAEYGTYYNWNPVENLHIKAGGAFEVLAGLNIAQPNSINNQVDVDFQPQFKAAAGIKYGWNFRKVGIHLYADLKIPFMGFMTASSKYQGITDAVQSEILPGSINHMKFSSFHNYSGYNLDMGVDFVFRKLTFTIANVGDNRWWNAYGVQNYRRFNLTKIGFSVDLVSRTRLNSNNRYF